MFTSLYYTFLRWNEAHDLSHFAALAVILSAAKNLHKPAREYLQGEILRRAQNDSEGQCVKGDSSPRSE